MVAVFANWIGDKGSFNYLCNASKSNGWYFYLLECYVMHVEDYVPELYQRGREGLESSQIVDV